MEHTIITSSGKINDYIHLVDLHEFGFPHILSVFIAEFDDCCILMDSGSSLDVIKLMKYLKKAKIPLQKINYLTTSHHHFDHNGGIWKLYEKLKKHNPNVKILTNEITKELLNDYEFHLARGRRTYGDFIGKMKPIEEEAFEIIKPSYNFTNNNGQIKTLKHFRINGRKIKLIIIGTPGHTPDHQSIAFINEKEEIEFIFLGEAAGTLYHSSKLITTPTSMPIFFDYEEYMNSLHNLLKLSPPLNCGFGHFGVVRGKENIAYLLKEHEEFMKNFHDAIMKLYHEYPETKYIVENVKPLFKGRYDIYNEKSDMVFDKILLGVVYGMMLSLGYRSITKKEVEKVKKIRSILSKSL